MRYLKCSYDGWAELLGRTWLWCLGKIPDVMRGSVCFLALRAEAKMECISRAKANAKT